MTHTAEAWSRRAATGAGSLICYACVDTPLTDDAADRAKSSNMGIRVMLRRCTWPAELEHDGDDGALDKRTPALLGVSWSMRLGRSCDVFPLWY